MPHVPHRVRARGCGFTLIELLVVVTIIGVLASVVVLGFVGADRERELKTEAQRLALLIELARDEALQRNEEWGVYIADDHYGFGVYDDRKQTWSEHEDGRFRRRAVEHMRLAIKVDALVPPGQEELKGVPQIIIFSSGEQTPFEITLKPDWESRPWLVASDGVARTGLERGA